jgi:hypothetical protein
METNLSIPKILNEIFFDFNETANLIVHYQLSGNTQVDKEGQFPDLISLNGQTGFPAFLNHLHGMQAAVINSILMAEKNMEPADRSIFLRQALLNCSNLMSVVTPYGMGYEESVSAEPGIPRMLLNRQLRPGAGEPGTVASPEQVTGAVSLFTMPYAANWSRVVHGMQVVLQQSLEQVEIISSPVLMEKRPQHAEKEEEKIRIRSNLPLFAAFCRMLFDLGLFDMDNKSKFCRIIVGMFSTKYKNELSSSNFKNHFDGPTPEIIEQLIGLLDKMLHYLRDFTFNL